MKKVQVKWYDTVSMNGWQTKSVVERFCNDGLHVMESTGYLYKKTKNAVVLVQSKHNDQDNYSEALMIPKACIIEIKKFK